MTTFHKLSDRSFEFYFLDNGYQGIKVTVVIGDFKVEHLKVI